MKGFEQAKCCACSWTIRRGGVELPPEKLQVLWNSTFASAEVGIHVMNAICMDDAEILVTPLWVGARFAEVVELNPKTQFLQADRFKKGA